MKTAVKPSPSRKTKRIDPASYRTPMTVTELVIYWNHDSHYVCPRCRITLDREFTNYCDRCGQKLSWKDYKKAKQIFL